MIRKGQWNQLASKWLTDPPGAWGIITNSGLVTAAGKLNSQRWLGDPMHSFLLSLRYHCPFICDSTEQGLSLEKEAEFRPQSSSRHPYDS